MAKTLIKPSFWKTAFIFGFPAGLLIIGFMLASFTFFGFKSGASSMAIGFALMLFIMLSLFFIGIKNFRNQQNGTISFGKALLLGVAMALFSALAYTLVWEIYVAFTGNRFIIEYTDHLIELERAKNGSVEALSQFIQKQELMREKYANRSYRMPVTFIENFPMGCIVALVVTFFLHKPKFWSQKA